MKIYKRIKLTRKLSRLERFVFSTCACSIRNLTWLFLGIALGEQFISAAIEYFITGESFVHWFDYVFLYALSMTYFYYAHQLGDFLLDLTLNAEVEEEVRYPEIRYPGA